MTKAPGGPIVWCGAPSEDHVTGAEPELSDLQGGVSAEALERLGTLWQRVPSGRPALLLGRPVEHPTVFARFFAYDFIGPRGSSAWAGWFLSGYLARMPSGEVVLERLAIEPEHEAQPGVTTEVLRSIAPAGIIVGTQAFLEVIPEVLALVDESIVVTSPRRGRPPLYDDEH